MFPRAEGPRHASPPGRNQNPFCVRLVRAETIWLKISQRTLPFRSPLPKRSLGAQRFRTAALEISPLDSRPPSAQPVSHPILLRLSSSGRRSWLACYLTPQTLLGEGQFRRNSCRCRGGKRCLALGVGEALPASRAASYRRDSASSAGSIPGTAGTHCTSADRRAFWKGAS
jgi:hypothetical protein